MPDVTDRISQVSQIYILAEKQNSNFNGRIKINCELFHHYKMLTDKN